MAPWCGCKPDPALPEEMPLRQICRTSPEVMELDCLSRHERGRWHRYFCGIISAIAQGLRPPAKSSKQLESEVDAQAEAPTGKLGIEITVADPLFQRLVPIVAGIGLDRPSIVDLVAARPLEINTHQ